MNNYKEQFLQNKICVLLPTYNNGGTLKNVIERIRKCTNDLIVVNDGSTDDTAHILESFPDITVLTISPNKGKGNALRTGFKYAHGKGYEYAITIDSDGQHFPEDLPLFLEKIVAEPHSLIIGARNMTLEGIPGKSSFGNKFSNFWYKVETGITLPDTQTGYRLYPLQKLANLKYFTPKFEFEIEVLVRAAWKGINVTYIPVQIYYAPGDERISHFRPFRDFTRISILNTFLVFLAFLFFRPRLWFRRLKKKSLKEIVGISDSNSKIATALGFGVFIGIFPVWGFQMLVGVGVAHIAKLNKFLVLLSANISIPPALPFILYMSLKTGEYILPEGYGNASLLFNKMVDLFEFRFNWSDFFTILGQSAFLYFVGAIVFAIIAGLSTGIVSILLLTIFRKQK